MNKILTLNAISEGLSVETRKTGDMVLSIPHIEEGQYLSDFLKEIPTNVLFDKANCGIGGTFQELVTPRDSIIAVPLRLIVESKMNDSNILERIDNGLKVSLIPIMEGCETNDIVQAIILAKESGNFIKFICTYDSTPRVLGIMKSHNLDTSAFFLLVDEYHILLEHYGFRSSSIDGLLSICDQFPVKTFMTATPIARKFLPRQIADMKMFSIKVKKTPKNPLVMVETDNVESALGKEISRLKSKNKESYFLYSNVSAISRIIEDNGLDSSDVRVICALGEDDRNVKILERQGVCVSGIVSEARKFNFITSAGFIGLDIKSSQADVYIVLDSKSQSLRLDIPTSFVQAFSRVRDLNKNIDVTIIAHIGNSKRRTLPDIKKGLRKSLKVLEKNIAKYNKYISKLKGKRFTIFAQHSCYTSNLTCYNVQKDNTVKISDNSFNYELWKETSLNDCYLNKKALVASLKKVGFDIRESVYVKSSATSKTERFEDSIKAYYSLRDQLGELERLLEQNAEDKTIEAMVEDKKAVIFAIEECHSNYSPYYSVLSIEDMEQKGFNARSVKALYKLKKASLLNIKKDSEMLKAVVDKWQFGESYELDGFKYELSRLFKEIGYDKAASIKVLKEFLKCDISRPRNKETGKRIYMVVLVDPIESCRLDIVKEIKGEFKMQPAQIDSDMNTNEFVSFLLEANLYLSKSDILSCGGDIEQAKGMILARKSDTAQNKIRYEMFYRSVIESIPTKTYTRLSTVLSNIDSIALGSGVVVDAKKFLSDHYDIEEQPMTGKQRVPDIALNFKECE